MQEIIKDAQAFVTDEEKGNDLAALADFADMFVNPVRMMSCQQALTQQAMEQVILKKAPWLLTIFNKLPTWVKLLIIAILAIGVVGYLFLTGAFGTGQDKEYKKTLKKMKDIQKKGEETLEDAVTDRKGRVNKKQKDTTNYEGGYLQVYDQDGKLITFGDKDNKTEGLTSPIFLSPDPLVSEYQASKMGHVEDQTVKWAIDEIKAYNQAHPENQLSLLR